MKSTLPEDLQQACDLLDRADRAENAFDRQRDLHQALEIFEKHLGRNPNSPHRQLINDLKASHARRLLKILPDLGTIEMGAWFHYLLLFVLENRLAKETEVLRKQDHRLKQNYENFVSLHKDTLEYALGKA